MVECMSSVSTALQFSFVYKYWLTEQCHKNYPRISNYSFDKIAILVTKSLEITT